jgi:hypothetical protein
MGHSMNILTMRAGINFKWLIFFISVSYIDYYYDFVYFYLLIRNYLVYLFRYRYLKFLAVHNIVFSSLRVGQDISGNVNVKIYVYDRVFIKLYKLFFSIKNVLKVRLNNLIHLDKSHKTLKKKRKWHFKTYKWWYFRYYNMKGKKRKFYKRRRFFKRSGFDKFFVNFAKKHKVYLDNLIYERNFRVLNLLNRDSMFVRYGFYNKLHLFRDGLRYLVTNGFFYPKWQFKRILWLIKIYFIISKFYLFKKFYIRYRIYKKKKKNINLVLNNYFFFNEKVFQKVYKKILIKKPKRKIQSVQRIFLEKKIKKLEKNINSFFFNRYKKKSYKNLKKKKLKRFSYDQYINYIKSLSKFIRKRPIWENWFLEWVESMFRYKKYVNFFIKKRKSYLYKLNQYKCKLLKKKKKRVIDKLMEKKKIFNISRFLYGYYMRRDLFKLPKFYKRNKHRIMLITQVYNLMFRRFFFKFLFIKTKKMCVLNFKFVFLFFYLYITRRFFKILKLLFKLHKVDKYKKKKRFLKLRKIRRLLKIRVSTNYLLYILKRCNYLYLFGIFFECFLSFFRYSVTFTKVIKYFYIVVRQWFWFLLCVRNLKNIYIKLYLRFKKFFYCKLLVFFKKLNLINLIVNSKITNFNIYPNSLLTLSGDLFLLYVKWKLARKFTLNQVVWPFVRHLRNVNFWFIKGFFLKGSGRFTRRQRAVVQKYSYGQIKFSTYNVRLFYYYIFIVTRYGKCGLKLWFNVNNKFIMRNFNKVYRISIL